MADYDDPGWRAALRAALPLLLIPPPLGVLPVALIARRKNLDGLTRLRAIFIRLVVMPFFILVVLYLVVDDAAVDAGWIPWFVAGVAVLDIAGVWWAKRRELSVSSAEGLAGSYLAAFFISRPNRERHQEAAGEDLGAWIEPVAGPSADGDACLRSQKGPAGSPLTSSGARFDLIAASPERCAR